MLWPQVPYSAWRCFPAVMLCMYVCPTVIEVFFEMPALMSIFADEMMSLTVTLPVTVAVEETVPSL